MELQTLGSNGLISGTGEGCLVQKRLLSQNVRGGLLSSLLVIIRPLSSTPQGITVG